MTTYILYQFFNFTNILSFTFLMLIILIVIKHHLPNSIILSI